MRDEETGHCVDPEDCTNCDVGESHLACGRTCEGTCANPSQPEKCQLIVSIHIKYNCPLNLLFTSHNYTDIEE